MNEKELLKYKKMLTEQEKSKNNYRIIECKCCMTCINAAFGYDGEIWCKILCDENDYTNEVEDLGFCDKYCLRKDE